MNNRKLLLENTSFFIELELHTLISNLINLAHYI